MVLYACLKGEPLSATFSVNKLISVKLKLTDEL